MDDKTITLYNGNDQAYQQEPPELCILIDGTSAETKNALNEIVLNHIKRNTGLEFSRDNWNNYKAKANNFGQIGTLLLTYNFKTQYHNNASTKNTIFLKFCNNEGFKVDSICYECCKDNGIYLGGLISTDKLSV